jgi:hypothetical protein
MPGTPAIAALNPSEPLPQGATGGSDVPSRSGHLIGLLRKLVEYGKELVHALQSRPAATMQLTFMVGFGTRDIALILARMMRGLRIAVALDDRLVQNAAQLNRPPAKARAAPLPRKPRADAQSPAPQVTRWTDAIDPRLAQMPTAEEIAAELRRRPIGAVIEDICRDLGLSPSHPLWRELKDAVLDNGSSFLRLMWGMSKRNRLTNFFLSDTPMIPPMPVGWRAPPRAFALPVGNGPP